MYTYVKLQRNARDKKYEIQDSHCTLTEEGAGWFWEEGKIGSFKDNQNTLIELNCTYVYRMCCLILYAFYTFYIKMLVIEMLPLKARL